jgi:transcription initiation factor TFIID TATA-box-binding protein
MQIVNIVATAKVAPSFDLQKMKETINSCDFGSTSKVWLKMRLMPEGYYTAFYKSGKFVITGAKSIEQVDVIANRVISLLKDVGIDINQKEVKLHNFVVQDQIEMKTTLEKLVYVLNYSKTNYEPEQFPGLIYKDWGATFILFSTGKITITGIKKENDINYLIDKFKNLIMSYS